jgi:hypothetical protein
MTRRKTSRKSRRAKQTVFSRLETRSRRWLRSSVESFKMALIWIGVAACVYLFLVSR